MRRWLVLAMLLTGCGGNHAPTVFTPPDVLPLRIRMYPEISVAYVDTRIFCMLPADVGEGVYSFGIEGQFRSAGPIDRIVYDRVIRMPCEGEDFTIVCGYKEQQKEWKQVRLDVRPVGECR